MIPPSLPPSFSLFSQPAPTAPATTEENQQLLLNVQNKVLKQEMRYLDELENRPANLEGAQLLGVLATACNVSNTFLDLQG